MIHCQTNCGVLHLGPSPDPCLLFYPHGHSFDVCRVVHKMCSDTPYGYNPFFLPCPRSLDTVCARLLVMPSETPQRVLSAAGVIAYLSTLAVLFLGSLPSLVLCPCSKPLLSLSARLETL